MVAVLGQAACDSSSEGPSRCDPLAAVAAPLELADIVGIGRDVDGRIYVADAADGMPRVFVAAYGGELARQSMSASGGGSDEGVESFFYVVGDEEPRFVLQVETTETATRMGVLFDPGETETFVIGQEGVELEVLGVEDVAGIPVADLPGEIVIEYAAQLEDGRTLIVIRPRDAWSYEDFRAFFGPVDDLVESPISEVERLSDGGSTTIRLEIDGDTATASFPIVSEGTRFVPGPATLELGGESHALARLHNAPEGAAYRCR
jgi:hypothetical protein